MTHDHSATRAGHVAAAPDAAAAVSSARNGAPPSPLAFDVLAGYGLVRAKLSRVQERLDARVATEALHGDGVGQYLARNGGKRVRPTLLLLVSQMLGSDGDDRDVQYATIVEMLHMATLLHDDVIDEATTRHGRGSINARWGNTFSVLFGDMLFTDALDQAIDDGDIRILKLLSVTTRSLVMGELLELKHATSALLGLDMALEITRRKTADLFGVACTLPAYLNGRAYTDRADALASFGRNLGMAFQLMDDLLDYTGSGAHVGKPVLSDLCQGKVTVPLIIALAQAPAHSRRAVETVLEERAFRTVPRQDILDIVQQGGGIEETQRMAAAYTTQALRALDPLPASPAKSALLEATAFLLARTR